MERANSARKWLPNNYPAIDQKQAKISYPITFKKYTKFKKSLNENKVIYEQLLGALAEKTLENVFIAIGAIFNCHYSQICLIEVHNEKSSLAYFRVPYNHRLNCYFRETGEAEFDYRVKAWDVNLTAAACRAISSHLPDFFSVVIDLKSLSIFTTKEIPRFNEAPSSELGAIPFHVTVTRRDFDRALWNIRPSDRIKEHGLYIHDGSSFVKINDFPSFKIYSQIPFLLFRYSVENGKPRYVILATLTMRVEKVLFGGADKKSNMAIARTLSRYVASCQILQLPPFIMDEANTLQELPDQRSQLTDKEFTQFYVDV